MTPVAALLTALDLQVEIGQRVRAEDLLLPSPCDGWTVRDVCNHSLGVTSKFAAFASGVTNEPHTPSVDLVGVDHVAALRRVAADARAAWGTADLTRSCRLTFGTFSAGDTARINLFDVLAHTWDIATAADLPLSGSDDLWRAGLEAAQRVIGRERDLLQFAPEIPVDATAPPMHRVLGYLGRSPNSVP